LINHLFLEPSTTTARTPDSTFGYFHINSISRQKNMVQYRSSIHSGTATYKPIIPPLQSTLPVLEDAESIQLSISMLVTAFARDRIEPKRAGLMLYGLQLASTNVRNITPPEPDEVVHAARPTCDGTDLALEDEANDEEEAASEAQEALETASWETRDPSVRQPEDLSYPTGPIATV
jgi:hypothetical protein